MVGWYSNLGMMWRVALPLVLIACSLAIAVGAIFSNRTVSGDSHEREDVATIAFIEADVPAPGADSDESCSAAKRDAIWAEAENLLSSYWKRAVQAPGASKWSLWMYPLNSAPGAGKEIVRLGPRELADVNGAKGLTRTQREKDGWKKYAQAAKLVYEKSLEQHPRQDIVGAVRYILTNRNKFVGDEVGTIKLVFISDMLHYNCDAGSVDPEAGYWNFLSLDTVEKFQKQIDEGVLYHQDGETTSVNVPIEPFIKKPDDRTLQVFSVSIPRHNCERIPAQDVNRILATGQIQKTWERLFEKMNAKSILLNVDSDRVFER
jgi:hypothetical protein